MDENPRIMENPWNIESIYDLQYFNCPSCLFKDPSKQELINHAFEVHPDSTVYLVNIKDDSLMDVICPWNVIEIKKEGIESEMLDPSMLEVCIKSEEEEDFSDDSNTESEESLERFITGTPDVDVKEEPVEEGGEWDVDYGDH